MQNKDLEIKIGDYIIGTEQWGREAIPEYGIESTLCQHEMRGWVDSIFTDKNTGNKSYNIKSDDAWKGARGGFISEEFGPVTKVETTDIEPFWWIKNKVETMKEIYKTWHREWKAFDLVRHFKGDLYQIIDIGIDTETEQEVIIYKRADNTGNVWVRNRNMFEREVDHNKYPKIAQKWCFEKVEY